MYLIHKELITQEEIILPKRKMFHFWGEARGILRDLNGRVLQDTGWIKNQITAYGGARLYSGFPYMQLGSGSGVTLPGDVTLKTPLGTRVYGSTIQVVNAGAPNYTFYETLMARFDAGNATGTIVEVGMHSATSGSNLYCRAEIPAIVKGAENVLDMYYRMNVTPDISDKTGTVVIDGVTYDYIVRPYDADLWTKAFSGIGPMLSAYVPTASPSLIPVSVASSKPGDVDNMWGHSWLLDAGEPNVSWKQSAYLDDCNFTLPGGIRSCYSRFNFGASPGVEGGIGVQLTSVDGPNPGNGVPKDNTQYFTAQFKVTWSS